MLIYIYDMLIVGNTEAVDEAIQVLHVGSHQVPFPMCTLETLQKYCSTGSLLLTFC